MFAVVRHRRIVAALLLLVAAQLVLTVFLCARFFEGESTSLIDFTVVLDAGHGGVDGGVVANGVKESDLNLVYTKTLGEIFSRGGFNVVLTRSTHDGLYGVATSGFKQRDMQKRKQIILSSKPNLVISVHMNKFSQTTRSGPQVFFQQGVASGQQLAESLQTVFNNFTGNNHQAIGGDFFICRESPCTSVIVECGFLSNADEAARLQTDDYRDEICNRIFDGVMLYLYAAQ